MILKRVYALLGLNGLAWEVASGQIKIPRDCALPIGDIDTFPPAFIPMQSEDTNLLGFWKHWFCTNRSLTIVDLSRENYYQVTEVARDIKQYMLWKIYEPLLSIPKLGEKEILFINQYALGDPSFILDTGIEYYDDPDGMIKLQVYKDDPPVMFGKKYYKGDFYLEDKVLEHDLYNYSGLEIPEYALTYYKDLPPWLKEGPKFNLFIKYIEQKDWAKSWLTLNSHGWTFGQAVEAMEMLAQKVPDNKFRDFANLWLSFDHELDYCY